MRYVLALCAGLLCACLQAGERQRFRVVNRCDAPTFTVVNNCSKCTYCTDCKCATSDCPGKCPVQAAAVVPAVYAEPVTVSQCAGGNCAAPVQSRGLFGFRRW